MKRKGSHPYKSLSALKINGHMRPGRYADGNGLYLIVDPSGARRWVLRTVVQGKRRDIGLGSARLVSLAKAREVSIEYRQLARQGGNPLSARTKQLAIIPTFAEIADSVFKQNRSSWRNQKHASQWLNTLRTYAFPVLGDMQVDAIGTPEILRTLSPIWLSKPETARRVKQRINTVLDWAKAAGFREGDNPTNGVSKGLPRQPASVNHFAAIPFDDVPSFVEAIKSADSSLNVRLAFEFLVLTAARTNEVLGAKWTEFDLTRRVWEIPARRMKVAHVHRVPLSDRATEIIQQARSLGLSSEYVFAHRSEKSLSNMVFLMLLRRMGKQFTAHGFRSAFRDWAAERTNFPRDVCEMALAHTISNKVEAAYRRGDLFEKRRQLMEEWSDYTQSNGREKDACQGTAAGKGQLGKPDQNGDRGPLPVNRG